MLERSRAAGKGSPASPPGRLGCLFSSAVASLPVLPSAAGAGRPGRATAPTSLSPQAAPVLLAWQEPKALSRRPPLLLFLLRSSARLRPWFLVSRALPCQVSAAILQVPVASVAGETPTAPSLVASPPPDGEGGGFCPLAAQNLRRAEGSPTPQFGKQLSRPLRLARK